MDEKSIEIKNREITNLSDITVSDFSTIDEAKSLWQLGDWQSLSKIDLEKIQNRLDKGIMALFAGVANLQLENIEDGRRLIKLAKECGISKSIIGKVLISSLHTTLGRIYLAKSKDDKASDSFKKALELIFPYLRNKILGETLACVEAARMGLLPQAVKFLDTQLKEYDSIRREKKAKLKILETELELIKHKISSLFQNNQLIESSTVLEHQQAKIIDSESIQLMKIDFNSIKNEISKIPPEDFVSSTFDQQIQTETSNILVIFTTPRSGSTLLCDILIQNNICIAHEYFQPYQYLPILAKRWGCIDDKGFLNPAAYVSALCKYRTLQNGWLGIKVHSGHIFIFDSMLKYFPKVNIQYIHFIRRDTLAQAVSYAFARQTNKWTSYFVSTNEANYDFNIIKHLYHTIIDGNALIESYVSKRNLVCHKFYYEDLIEKPEEFFISFSKVVPNTNSIEFRTKLVREDTNIKQSWISKYKSDLYVFLKKNKIGALSFINK